ncbi:unnamed protein product [Caenorhabditis angaria]|uniref:DOMON domain-containing protein n=1 Tax=Caenorhabditis angaria TaxID=860376 RepID=A0A9P1IQW4_9PELO|nr:unnamed protein product [Caenorhabditis angaria]
MRPFFSFFLSFFIFGCKNVFASNCSFENDLVQLTWRVRNDTINLNFVHKNFKNTKFTAIAFGNGPGMTNLEAIIFSNKNGSIVTRTGYTPKYGKVIYDESSYVQIPQLDYDGTILQVSITRPLGSAGPRNFSLDQCIDWDIIPGSRKNLMKKHKKKHHGGAYKIKNVCAAQCTTSKFVTF